MSELAEFHRALGVLVARASAGDRQAELLLDELLTLVTNVLYATQAGDQEHVDDLLADAHARAYQTVVANFYPAGIFVQRPHGKSYFAVRCANDIDVSSHFNGGSKNFYMPGFHKLESLTQRFQLRSQKMIGIKFLEFQVGFFYQIWAMIAVQEYPLGFYDRFASLQAPLSIVGLR